MAPRWSVLSAAVSFAAGSPPPFGWPPACGLARALGGLLWACSCRRRSSVFSTESLLGAGFFVTFGCDVVLGGDGGGGTRLGGTGNGGSSFAGAGGVGGAGGGGTQFAADGEGSGGGGCIG